MLSYFRGILAFFVVRRGSAFNALFSVDSCILFLCIPDGKIVLYVRIESSRLLMMVWCLKSFSYWQLVSPFYPMMFSHLRAYIEQWISGDEWLSDLLHLFSQLWCTDSSSTSSSSGSRAISRGTKASNQPSSFSSPKPSHSSFEPSHSSFEPSHSPSEGPSLQSEVTASITGVNLRRRLTTLTHPPRWSLVVGSLRDDRLLIVYC